MNPVGTRSTASPSFPENSGTQWNEQDTDGPRRFYFVGQAVLQRQRHHGLLPHHRRQRDSHRQLPVDRHRPSITTHIAVVAFISHLPNRQGRELQEAFTGAAMRKVGHKPAIGCPFADGDAVERVPAGFRGARRDGTSGGSLPEWWAVERSERGLQSAGPRDGPALSIMPTPLVGLRFLRDESRVPTVGRGSSLRAAAAGDRRVEAPRSTWCRETAIRRSRSTPCPGSARRHPRPGPAAFRPRSCGRACPGA